MMQTSNDIWQIQADTAGRDDFDFFVTENSKYSIYFSKIAEYGMMKFDSPVQIWTDRENPKLIFQSRQIRFEYQYGESCYYLDKSDILILLTPCMRETHFELLYVLFDFNTKTFASINAPNFHLTEVEKGVIRQDIHFRYSYDEFSKLEILADNGKLMGLTLLEWHDMKQVDRVCSFGSGGVLL